MYINVALSFGEVFVFPRPSSEEIGRVGVGWFIGTGVVGEQLLIDRSSRQMKVKKKTVGLLMLTITPHSKEDTISRVLCIIKGYMILCYNAATMRYERTGNSFLCVGLRGFIYERPSGIAPVARR